MYSCLIVEDESISLNILQEEFQAAGYEVTALSDGGEAYEQCRHMTFDLVLLDMLLPHKNGMEILRAIRTRSTRSVVVIITAYGRIESAVEAIKAGADDYVTKPYDMAELMQKVERILRSRANLLNVDLEEGPREATYEPSFQDTLSAQVRDVIRKVKDIDTTVLITGESGTGKGVVAKEIHYSGKRAALPFIHVNCAAIQPNLIESELFGHEKGSFTGANTLKKGKFELAGEGTIFLDEIGIMPLNLQSRLLTVLQDRYYERVGGVRRLPIHARIIAATNEDLENSVREGTFRLDLYYRLNVVRIEVPPLRYRRNDIVMLANTFIDRFQKSIGKNIQTITDDFWDVLLRYDWPGNIRELENAIEAAVALCDDDMLTSASLPIRLSSIRQAPSVGVERQPSNSYKQMLNQQDAAIVAAALEKFGGHREKTAQYLGISKRTLQYKLKQFGLN